MNIVVLQKKVDSAKTLEELKELLDEIDYEDYCDITIPSYGGNEPIPIDVDTFSYEIACDNDIESEEMSLISWDEDGVLVLVDTGLEIVDRDTYANICSGVLCPFCKTMVNLVNDCPHLICTEEHVNFTISWSDKTAEKKFKNSIMDKLPSIEDAYEREEVESGIEKDEVFWWGAEDDVDRIVNEAWESVSSDIKSVEVSYSAPHGHGSWGLVFWFAPSV